jgi:hypothetical protein
LRSIFVIDEDFGTMRLLCGAACPLVERYGLKRTPNDAQFIPHKQKAE